MKSERKKIIDKCDSVFREIIRLRDKVCQRTGKSTNLQVAHYFTRSNMRTRWDEANACLLNAGTHLYWAHKNHEEFRDFWIERIGQEEFERLKLRTRVRGTIYTSDLEVILIGLKARYEQLKKELSCN